MMDNFAEKSRFYKELTEKELDRLLPPQETEYGLVVDAMRYSLLNGGKRIRAMLTLGFCDAFFGDCRPALSLACAIEMVQAYSLIHDDLPCMDDDDFRRGKPSCHRQFDEATALLAGDGLLTLAFEIAAIAPISPERRVEALSTLSRGIGYRGMVGGQVIDMKYENRPVTREVLEQMYLLKTSALISASSQLGAIAGGAAGEQVAAVARYSEKIGLAFQITDDILDIVGDEKLLGKPVHSDVGNQKTTLASLYGVERAQSEADSLFDQARAQLDALQLKDRFLYELTDFLAQRKY